MYSAVNLLFIITCLGGSVYSNYDCLCNYNVEKSVLPSIGYVEKDSRTHLQLCPGYPPLEDKVTTSTVATAITTTQQLTSRSTSTLKPATTSTTMKPTKTMKPTTTSTKTTMARTTAATTTTVLKQTTTMKPSTMKPTTTTMLPTTSSTTLKTSTLPTTKSTTTTVPTSTVKPTPVSSATTSWRTETSSTTIMTSSFTSDRPDTSTTRSTGKFVCPLNVQQAALSEGSLAFVNDDNRKCYEFVQFKRTWSFAEDDCKGKGGHLTSIENTDEEKLLNGYVHTYGSNTWIGLNDKNSEENFEWSSGDILGYQNWQAGRKDPIKQIVEDCVTMDSVTGTWEDESCSRYYAYICKFDAVVDNGMNRLTTHTYTASASLPTSSSSLPLTTSGKGAVTSHQGSFPSVDGNTHLCSSTVRHFAERDNAILGQYERECYELIRTADVSWQHGEDMCQSRGGHLAYISSAQKQAFIQSFLNRHSPQHAVWIGLHDTRIEGAFEWTAGTSVSYTNWIPGHMSNFGGFRTEDCVAFIPYKNGKWDDIPCGNKYDLGETHPILCQYNTVTSNQGSLTSVEGNTQLCSSTVRHLAERDNTILGQYERGCYELIRTADVSWQHGEDMCQSRGGHLAYISSAQQQTFIQSLLNRHSPQHAVWIGLHDTRIEGAFEWTAGTSVSYTNWIPGHMSNFASFRTEDCVAFIPYKNGKWDDIPCGNTYDLGETHPVLCQYKTPLTPGIVG